MTATLVANVLAYSVQLGALVLAVAGLARACRIADPEVRRAIWTATFAAACVLPAVGLWAAGRMEVAPILFDRLQAGVAGPENAEPEWQLRWVDAIAAVLVAGIILRLGRVVMGGVRLHQWAKRAVPMSSARPDGLPAAAGDDAERLVVRVTDATSGPVTVGIWHPVVLVPPRFLDQPPAVRRAVLCHELMHVRQRDPLRILMAEVWCACLWFHPAARALVARLELAREMCLDRMTIALTGDRRAYAQALLAFGSADLSPGVPAFIRRTQLSQRVEAITREIDTMPFARRWAAIALVVCLATGTTAAAARVAPMPGSVPLSGMTTQEPVGPGPGIQMPTIVQQVRPEYPRAARDAKVQGAVLLSMVVETDGSVGPVTVVRSVDETYGLDQAAVTAASQWRFEPGRKDDQPVPVRVELEIVFTLRP